MIKMRDPERINKLLIELSDYWKNNPDLRLGQLLVNAAHQIIDNSDPFYLEDQELINYLTSQNKK